LFAEPRRSLKPKPRIDLLLELHEDQPIDEHSGADHDDHDGDDAGDVAEVAAGGEEEAQAVVGGGGEDQLGAQEGAPGEAEALVQAGGEGGTAGGEEAIARLTALRIAVSPAAARA
jgi:hypothetical protein